MAEVLNKYCGVYLIVSPSNGRYIGSSKSLSKRFNRYKNLSCANQYALISSFKKYGFENHKIKVLIYCIESELLFWERVFGDLYLSLADFPNGLNIRLPGYGDVPQSLIEEMRKVIKLGCKKRWSNIEEREKTSQRAKIAMQSSELRNRLREAAINQWDEKARNRKSEERVLFYKNNPEERKKSSERFKKIMSERPYLRLKAKETFNLYYESHPRINARKVYNINTGEIFQSIESAALSIGVRSRNLARWLSGRSPNNTPIRYFEYIKVTS